MRFSFSAATLLLLSDFVSTTPILSSRDSTKGRGINAAIRHAGRSYIGTALTLRTPPDTTEDTIISNPLDFGSITPENAMKWETTEPIRGNFTFADADAVATYAAKHGKQMRCHTLVWHSQLPAWVSNGGFDNKTLIGIMEEHIRAVAGRYKGKCMHWDVVNEALNENGTYRDTVWYRTIGEAYLPIAFRFASQADPRAKLYYNDYNLEYANNKTLAASRIVKLVKSYGVKINGVGLQGHLTVEKTPTNDIPVPPQSTLEKSLRSFTDLGVDVAYTEVDIRMNTPATAQTLEKQAEQYAALAKSCLAVRRCVGITFWGVTDKHSWIPGYFAGEGAALLWDENYKKKPAYNSVLQALHAKYIKA